jgi:hypothetical protein
MAGDADTLNDALVEAAQKPKKAAGAMGSVEEHPLPDLIEAADRAATKEATRRRDRGLRFSKFIPPGGGC